MKWLKGRFTAAGNGFVNGLFKDRSILFQMILGLLAVLMAVLFDCTKEEWMWILLCITLVITGETFNSCIEQTIDYISLKRDPRAGLVKDMAAAGVSVLCIFSVIVALLIFIPKWMERFL